MDLYLLRHGKAGPALGSGDGARALTGAGRNDIRVVARWLKARETNLDVIATSPLVRAHETAEIIARLLRRQECLEIWDELAPGGDMDTICYHAAQYGREASALLVGHEPTLSCLAGRIITGGESASLILGKGGMMKIRNYAFETRPTGDLHWLLTARQIAGME